MKLYVDGRESLGFKVDRIPTFVAHPHSRDFGQSSVLHYWANAMEIKLKIPKFIAKAICRVDDVAAGLVVGLMTFAPHATAQVEYVDPTIGNVGILLVPTRPAVYLPNSMVRVYPTRSDALNDQIESFPLTISSHRMRELFSIMHGEGGPAAYDQEKTTPYYLSTRFDDSLIQ